MKEVLAFILLITSPSCFGDVALEIPLSFDIDIFHQILRRENQNLVYNNLLELQASVFSYCNDTKLAPEHSRAIDWSKFNGLDVLVGSKRKRVKFSSIAGAWTKVLGISERIQDSDEYACHVNMNCEPLDLDVVSCVFLKHQRTTTLPRTTSTYGPLPTYSPTPYYPALRSQRKPYALTPDMFNDILFELKRNYANVHYDNQYFMDHGSATQWNCPFPHPNSPAYVVQDGRVEVERTDKFGVIMELGKRSVLQKTIPYHDGEMRAAMKQFARRWNIRPVGNAGPIKFGCSVDPDCYGDMILLCAFYPINFRSIPWTPNPQPLSPSEALRYTDSMNEEARRLFGLFISTQLEDECLIVTTCGGPTPHQGFNKTYSGRLGKSVEILTGSTSPSEINHDISTILDRMKNRRYSYPYRFGCCYIPRCQKLVVSNCLFAEI